MIWFDGVHMASDVSLEELFEKADKMGLKREWLHKGNINHFDVFGYMISKIEKNCSSKELVKKCRFNN